MTVEVALCVMAGDRTDHLCLCDEDDQRTGLVTLTQLLAVRDSPTFTDRVRLRDVIGADGTPAAPATAPTDEGRPTGHRPLVTPPLDDEHDGTPGVRAHSH